MKTRFGLLAAALCLFLAAPAVVAVDAPIPRAPWKLELLASSPDIRHPSVVCTAPNGRIFVAEDPMDISAPANAPHGRIIAFHPDGRRTTFATNLYAVFGMQYLEGKLYVLHNPRFTAFKDSGDIGTDPEDLIESTNPNPWALDWNDHVPANFKLAMDGYFYMAVGDKGIYNAKTKDGRTINLHGGGVLRIRPDGTGAEVFATGVRNILDVAITSEDEIFTYDNTDEHDWMGRLTHMVDGGFYGYPHHFIPRRPYTLWMMHDFGGGAATGTFANTEDALPPEYHDNLFLADFGKRQIIRVVLERDGATFKVARHEELFSEMPDSFRPVGIAPSHDGKSIYICDWQHRDTKENVEVGRLWKLTWTGETFSQPKPSWFIPTAQGQKCEATDQQLSHALTHPSRSVRITAQRELSRRRVMPNLPANPPAYAQWHNIWALHNAPNKSLVVTALAEDSPLRRQQLRQIGHSSPSVAWRLVPTALKDPDASIRFHAATALGRASHDPLKFIDPLLNALPEPDLFARHAIERALNRLGHANSNAWKQIVSALTNSDSSVRDSITYALRETYDPALAGELRQLIQSAAAPQPAREAAINLLANITRKHPEWKGEWWAYHPALAPAPVKTVAWESTESILAVFEKVLSTEPSLRLATIRALAEANETSIAPDLRELFGNDMNDEVRAQILQALATFKDTNASSIVLTGLRSARPAIIAPALNLARFSHSAKVLTQIATLISDTKNSRDLRLEAIDTAAQLRNTEALPAIADATRSSDPRLRSAAIAALGRIGGPVATKTLLALFVQPDPNLHLEAANALAEIEGLNSLDGDLQKAKTDLAISRLLTLYNEDQHREAALDSLLRLPDSTAIPVYIDALGNANPTTRDRARKILEPFRERALNTVRSRIPTMRPVEIAEIQKLYPDRPDLTLLTREKVIPTVADYVNFALENKGDSTRGRRLFFNESGVACIKCHTVSGEGGAVGPDMTTIGAQFPRDALIEHIVNPSKSVREGYQQVLIETSDDESLAGLIKSESTDTLTLLTAQAKLETIPKSKITARHSSQLSLMPDGLHLGLSLEEFADLITYLESLKADPRK